MSRAAGVPLAGTATRADRWLVLEHRAPWGRDAAVDTELPGDVAAALDAFAGRVLLVRRPGRRTATITAFTAQTTEAGGTLRRAELTRLEDVVTLDPEREGDELDGPLILVCTHRRRDACCARRGVPVFNALRPHVSSDLLWRSSHHGGHRFAANVLALPYGIQLGRVEPGEAASVGAALADGRVPLDRYRGRSLHAPEVQAADAALRLATRLDHVADVRLLEHDGPRVVFSIPGEEVELIVEEVSGPELPASCGADPEPTTSLRASVVTRRTVAVTPPG